MCARVCVCARVRCVDVTVISDQYSLLATDLRSVWAQPSGQRQNTRTCTRAQLYTLIQIHTCNEERPRKQHFRIAT